LRKGGANVFTTGGERSINLSVRSYSDLMRKSKISLSFSRASMRMHCINARPFEIASCNSMLLEQSGIETPKLFTPYVDFIPYFGKRDCLDKINYFLKNDNERIEIASNAYNRVKNFFSAKRFWTEVIEFINSASYKNSDKLPIDKFGNEFWSLPIDRRGIPLFHVSQYAGMPASIVMQYRIINFLYTKLFFYNSYYYFFKIIAVILRVFRLPYTGPRRIYRMIMR
jgi:hypothetical protein